MTRFISLFHSTGPVSQTRIQINDKRLTVGLPRPALPQLEGDALLHGFAPVVARAVLALRRKDLVEIERVHARDEAHRPEALQFRHREVYIRFLARRDAQLDEVLRAAQHDRREQLLRGGEELELVLAAREVEGVFEELFGGVCEDRGVEPVEEAP